MLTNLYKSSTITLEKFTLISKFTFDDAVAHYTFYGEPDNGKKLALFFHGFSSDSELHIWWTKFPIKELLKNYNIICFNSLGSCHGSLGPETICPNTGLPYAENFPEISIADTVNFTILALKKMNIQKLDLVFGCSMGGMQALDMYIRFPMLADKFISVCASPLPLMTKLTCMAQSNIIEKGIKQNLSKDALQSSMGLGRFFFRLSCTTENALSILDKKHDLEEYYIIDSMEYETCFSPYSYNLLLKMLLNFQLNLPKHSPDNLKTNNEILLVGITDDNFTPPECINKIYQLFMEKTQNVRFTQFETLYGHESWILDGERFYEFIKDEFFVHHNNNQSTKFCEDLCQ